MSQIATILMYVSIFSVLLPIIFLLKRKENFKNAPVKVLGVLLFVAVLSELASYILIKMGKSNIAIINIYFLIQFFLLSYIYFLLLKNKKIIYTALSIFTGFFVINTIFIHSIYEYQSWSRFTGGVFIIIYSIKYYWQIFKVNPPIDFLSLSSFWLNIAVFFYFAFNLYLFATTNYIMKTMDLEANMIAWSFHSLNSIIKNILFMIAISYVGAKQHEAHEGKKNVIINEHAL